MAQTRKQRLASLREGKRLTKLGWNDFENVTVAAIEKCRHLKKDHTQFPDLIYQNNLFIVQVYLTQTSWGLVRRAMVRRNDERPVHNWAILQRIKNEIFGPEATALEVYPKESRLIDVANIYWLWVLPDDFDCPIERGKRDNF